MKKFFYHTAILLALFVSAGLASCMSESTEASTISEVTVQLVYPSDKFTTDVVPAGLSVKMSNKLWSYTAETDSRGYAVFSDVMPGIYNVSSSSILDSNTRALLVSAPADGIDVMANATLSSFYVFDHAETSITVDIGVSSNLVISKIFYAGSTYYNEKNIKYSSDQYIEIYNNSDETISTENIYIAITETNSTNLFLDAYGKDEYIFAKNVWGIPTMDIAPGGSIVIAREARDHTATSAFSIDLTSADFETKSLNNSVTTNPDKEGLVDVFHTNTTANYLLFVVKGLNSVSIFYSEEWPGEAFDGIYAPGKEDNSTYYHLQIPTNAILDGVETLTYANVKNNQIDAKKRLSNAVDASYVALDETYQAGNNQVSFDRKVIGITDSGRKVLKDTNNSTEDFVMLVDKLYIRDYTKEELYVDNTELLDQ